MTPYFCILKRLLLAGLLGDIASSVTGVLPFAVIAVTEGGKVLFKKKPGTNAVKDGAFRMLKTGAAVGIGSAVMGVGGLWAAIPVTMGVRALFDRYRSKALTGLRVNSRTERLRQINHCIRNEECDPERITEPVTPALPKEMAIIQE